MPELWDLYDIDRRPLNRTIQRGEALPEGTYHLAVGIAVFNTKGDILLTQRAQVKSQYPGCWEIPGGCAQAGETSLEAACRELREETGCTGGGFESMGSLIPTCAYDTEVIHLFFASDLTRGEQDLDENEFLSVERYTLDEALQMVLSGEIVDAKTQIGLFKYQALHNAGRI